MTRSSAGLSGLAAEFAVRPAPRPVIGRTTAVLPSPARRVSEFAVAVTHAGDSDSPGAICSNVLGAQCVFEMKAAAQARSSSTTDV
jgi:hypothetical protein